MEATQIELNPGYTWYVMIDQFIDMYCVMYLYPPKYSVIWLQKYLFSISYSEIIRRFQVICIYFFCTWNFVLNKLCFEKKKRVFDRKALQFWFSMHYNLNFFLYWHLDFTAMKKKKCSYFYCRNCSWLSKNCVFLSFQ